jgi:nitrate/nitrite-specific signal transduction histidine kinase
MATKQKSKEQQLKDRIAAAEAARKHNAKSEASAKLEQRANDLEALVKLETAHGSERILQVDMIGWVPNRGAATMVVVKLPETSDHKVRIVQELASKENVKAAAKVEASETLARQCLVYPSPKDHPDLYAATIELAPGILGHASNQIVKAVSGKAVAEGK